MSSSRSSAPRIDDRWLCIANVSAPLLAAVVSSYLFQPDCYLPLFIFPEVTAPRIDGDSTDQQVYLSNLAGRDTAVFIYNAWARIQNFRFVILVGLDSNQTSYLTRLPGTELITIDKEQEVPVRLAPLGLPKRNDLRCRSNSFLLGLYLAQKQEERLVIDENAELLHSPAPTNSGLVAVENVGNSTSVIAVNYASSIGSDLLVVPPLTEDEPEEITRAIQYWRDHGDNSQIDHVRNLISARITGNSIASQPFVTFFTEGLPYSVGVENDVPSSNVHLRLRPDHFVLNSILFETMPTSHSALLFSPSFFADEETAWLATHLARNNYYVRALLGAEASVAGLDYNVQHFPYNLLHISSHGGEVNGFEVSEQFVDRFGETHRLEYDQVVGYDPVPHDNGKYLTHVKKLPLALDGLRWKSKELAARKIPDYVFDDLFAFLHRPGINPHQQQKKKQRIPNSCAIRCSDNIHQGHFLALAAHSSPIVFNNSCFSWSEVAKFFLFNGARAYIGTLWAIDNEAAVIGAKTFYSQVFSDTILAAIHQAAKAIENTHSANVYHYWGLHFSTISTGLKVERSRFDALDELQRTVHEWRRHIALSQSEQDKRNSKRILQLVLADLRKNFGVIL